MSAPDLTTTETNTPDTAALQSQLTAAREELDRERTSRTIERELHAQGVISADSALALVEEAIAAGAPIPDAIAKVKQRAPNLFRARTAPPSATFSPARANSQPTDIEAAQHAASQGDRRALLRYLRLRRGA